MLLGLRGNFGNPSEVELSTSFWKEEGPFELSPERGRFILAYSIVENASFKFSEKLALFGSPDVAVNQNGEYVSLFAPFLSFSIIPGFWIGKLFNISQVGAFSIISLFAVINVFLIRKISRIWGVGKLSATSAGFLFLFATPAFAYGVNLYQHHVSTFLMLLSILLILKYRNFFVLCLIFFICTLALTLDYPNFFMFFPIGLAALTRFFDIKVISEKVKISIKPLYIFSLSTMVIPVIFLLWFNYQSSGNPFQLSGTLQTIKSVKKDLVNEPQQGLQPSLERRDKTAINFFETRNLTNGLYLHFVSPDRGMIFYTPVMFFAIIGMIIAYKRRLPLIRIFFAIIGINILLYSMWGDPWGGWAFGSRYLIPSYALLSIFIGIFLSKFSKNLFVTILFLIVLAYSIFVNTLGAITSSANPPQIEVLAIEKLSGNEEKYTYFRNLDQLMAGNSKSFIFRSFAKNYLQAWQYFYALFLFIFLSISSMTLLNFYLSKGGTFKWKKK